jgi:hypothetical protein
MNSSLPSFQNPIIEKLFQNDFTIKTSILQDIIALGSSVSEDLLLVLKDALQEPEKYTEDFAPDEGGCAPLHALFLLREIREEGVFPVLMDFLKGDSLVLDELFSELFITTELASFISLFGKKHLSDLEGLLLDQETDGYVRMAVATGLAQMTLQSPDTREAVEKILKKMFDFILEEENIQRIKDLEAIFEGSEYEIDLEFISNLVADALQADMKRFQGQIEEIFEQDLVDAEIITPEDMRFRTHLQKISDIFALYQELIEMESEEESLEEDEEDKPKIRKMKD